MKGGRNKGEDNLESEAENGRKEGGREGSKEEQDPYGGDNESLVGDKVEGKVSLLKC